MTDGPNKDALASRAAALQERYNFRHPLSDALRRRMDNPRAQAADGELITDDFAPVQETSGNRESPATSDESTESSPQPKAAASRTSAVEAHEDDESGSSTTSQKAARSAESEGSPVNSSTSSVELFWTTGIAAVLLGSSAELDDPSATRHSRRTWPAWRAKWGRRQAP